MTSVLNVDTIADKAGTGPVSLTKQSAAKAWLLADMNTVNTITASFNHSSVTDSGTGTYDFYLTNAMSDANYVFSGAAYRNAVIFGSGSGTSGTTASDYRVTLFDTSSVAYDAETGSLVHGDLA